MWKEKIRDLAPSRLQQTGNGGLKFEICVLPKPKKLVWIDFVLFLDIYGYVEQLFKEQRQVTTR